MIRLLVADDFRAVREVVREGLQDPTGRYRVVAEASDGQTALAQIRTLAPDVAILDVEMPGLTGPEVVRELRRTGDRTPVIFCTGSDPDLESPLPSGVVGCLRKPFRLESLTAAVEVAVAALGPDR